MVDTFSNNTNITNDINEVDVFRYDSFEFLEVQPVLSVILIIVLIIASVVGTGGNVLILVAVATQRRLRNVESVFVVNLASCDLYVTLIVDPLSIVGKTLGWRFFEMYPGMCRVVGSLCTISCVGSLMTLSALSCNRYVLICHQHLYYRLFTRRNSIIMCCSFYVVGFFLVSLNFNGIGDHSFDHKSLECIWDRMANHNYTIAFAIVMVIIPITVSGLSYLRLYLYVKKSRMKVLDYGQKKLKKAETSVDVVQSSASQDVMSLTTSDSYDIAEAKQENVSIDSNKKQKVYTDESDVTADEETDTQNWSVPRPIIGGYEVQFPRTERKFCPSKAAYECESENKMSSASRNKKPKSLKHSRSGKEKTRNPTIRLARTLFIIYLVFSVCWLPFSLLIVLDADDTFAHEIHVTIVAWAHLHPSINWLVYYYTNNKFRAAFRKLLRLDKCCG